MTGTGIVTAGDGTVNLHIWREGQEYLKQKGPSFLDQWNNLIFAALPGPPLANTRYVDLSATPLGFPDQTFDAVYTYHVFEHLRPSDGERCARQIFSALKAGGIWRVSVPDLETACRHYLDTLETADADSTRENMVRYRWAVMAIFEQMVRNRPGGMMLEAIERGEYDEEQLREMFGDMLGPLVQRRPPAHGDARPPRRVKHSSGYRLLRGLYRRTRTMLGRSDSRVAYRLDPQLTKEAVQWMYDRVSLRRLLEQAGFQDIRQTDHVSSRIAGWAGYDFDRSSKGGYPLDPSIYMEGRKPAPPRRDP